MDKSTQSREQWNSRLGFILAAMGSAVGLGNIWKFAYVTGENGGAAFILIYLACVFLIGVPIILAEFTIGRRAQSDAVGSFQKLAPNKPWEIGGFLGVIAAFIILSFYSVIAGWVLKYVWSYITGGLWSTPESGFGGYFGEFISGTYWPLFWHLLFMVMTVGVVVVGIKKGIEKANLILMPALGVLIVLLAVYSLTLGGAKEGLSFIFSPDWSAFADPKVYLAALGQAFFSLSLGMGALITYGSYLSKKEKLPSATVSVASLDTGFAIVAGIMIFPAIFAFGLAPDAGPGLIFIVLPEIFAKIGGFGIVVGLLFFLLVAAAALSSAISLLEVAVAFFMRKYEWSRKKATIILGVVIYLIGVPSALSQGGPLSGKSFLFGLPVLDGLAMLSDILLPIGGLVIALFVGWGWKKADALAESDMKEGFLASLWIFLLRYVAPVSIAIIILNATGLLSAILGAFGIEF
ncbi:sodium-dependent transporter [Lottiidibacillus patelloidae]|uniref:Transporter n=1 Tax=Lottiidibacillus patelloidae TaxID=2670334 RepID=A0A263BVN7_9BACI|nr:sodium-dependent transporter [Lottiidibacillus patelloidae]OZM57612.1 sodium-dependent transporter [Lottiidibacillus patelloidae]